VLLRPGSQVVLTRSKLEETSPTKLCCTSHL